MSALLPDLLTTLRTQLDATSSSPALPSGRAWANGSYTPVLGTPYVSDTLDLADTRPAALGLGQRKRTQTLYTARVHVPSRTAVMAAMRWAGAIANGFLNAALSVGASPVDVTEARIEGAFQSDDAWYVVPVSVFLQFDHA